MCIRIRLSQQAYGMAVSELMKRATPLRLQSILCRFQALPHVFVCRGSMCKCTTHRCLVLTQTIPQILEIAHIHCLTINNEHGHETRIRPNAQDHPQDQRKAENHSFTLQNSNLHIFDS